MPKIYHYTKLDIALAYILPSMTLRTNFSNNMNDSKEKELWAFGGININYKNISPDTYSNQTHIAHQ